MNPEFLSHQAIRLALRKSRKAGRPLTREEVLRLRVQTVEPWKRIAVAVMGLAVGVIAYGCYWGGAPWWIWAPFGLGGVVIVLCGLLGRKAYIDREFQKLSEGLPSRILDAIINALL